MSATADERERAEMRLSARRGVRIQEVRRVLNLMDDNEAAADAVLTLAIWLGRTPVWMANKVKESPQ